MIARLSFVFRFFFLCHETNSTFNYHWWKTKQLPSHAWNHKNLKNSQKIIILFPLKKCQTIAREKIRISQCLFVIWIYLTVIAAAFFLNQNTCSERWCLSQNHFGFSNCSYINHSITESLSSNERLHKLNRNTRCL